MRPCPECGIAAADLFCDQCGTLQQPVPEYFSFFGIPESLHLDLAQLQKRFYELSRKLHPDVFLRKGAFERNCSLEATAILNDAYRTLRDPFDRAEYVLRRHGFDIGEQRSKNVPPELLEEVFELNMALEELRGGDSSARPQIEQAHAHFAGMLGDIEKEIDTLAGEYDAGGGRSALEKIRAVLNRRRYVRNLLRDAEKELNPNVHVSD